MRLVSGKDILASCQTETLSQRWNWNAGELVGPRQGGEDDALMYVSQRACHFKSVIAQDSCGYSTTSSRLCRSGDLDSGAHR